MKCNNQHTLKK